MVIDYPEALKDIYSALSGFFTILRIKEKSRVDDAAFLFFDPVIRKSQAHRPP